MVMMVVEKPAFHPYACIQCGVNYNRKWYVDLGLRLDNAFNPQFDGVVYLCNECWWNVADEVERSVQKYLTERGENDRGDLEILSYFTADTNRELEPSISRSEGNDPEPIVSDNPTTADNPDESPDLVGEFRGFFS